MEKHICFGQTLFNDNKLIYQKDDEIEMWFLNIEDKEAPVFYCPYCGSKL